MNSDAAPALRLTTDSHRQAVLWFARRGEAGATITAPSHTATKHLVAFARELCDVGGFKDCTLWKQQPQWLRELWDPDTRALMLRASGAVVCDACERPYRDHPEDKEQLDEEGRPFLRIRCDGVRLKL